MVSRVLSRARLLQPHNTPCVGFVPPNAGVYTHLGSPFCHGEPGLARRVSLAWQILLRGVKPRWLLPTISSDLITYMTVILVSMYRKTPINVNGYFFLEMYQIRPLDYMEKYIISI